MRRLVRHFRRTRSPDNSDQRGERRGDALIIVSFAMRDLNYHRSPMQPQRSRPPSLPRCHLWPSVLPLAVRRAAPLLRKLLPNDLFRARDLEKRLSRHVPAAPSARSASLLCSALVWRGSRRSLPATDDQQATGRRASEQWIKGNDHSRIALNFVRSQVTSGNRVSRK